MAAEPSVREIEAQWNARRQRLQETATKITDLISELTEHELVIKTLEPMDPARKCFRLIGDVLVERSVAETLPAVVKNKDNLQKVVQSLQEIFKQQEKELSEFQAKYKIQVRRGNAPASSTAEPASASRAGPAGVLVGGN